MDIQLVVEFAELAKRLSITETAKALNMTQPTLSKHINQLETTLHIKLFSRSHYGLRVTREGLELLNEAYELIEAHNALEKTAKRLRENPLPRLSVAGLTNEDMISAYLGKEMTQLSTKYGKNFLYIKSSHKESPKKLVLDGAVDLAFDYIKPADIGSDNDLAATLVAKLKWYAIVYDDNHLYNKDSIRIEDLDGCTLLRMEGNPLCNSWDSFEKYLNSFSVDVKYKRQYIMKSTDLISACANQRDTTLILAESFLDKVVFPSNRNVKVIPVAEPDAYLPLSIVYKQDNKNPLLLELLECLNNKSE